MCLRLVGSEMCIRDRVKSHENISICDTFERLDHQKSQDFPIKIHQNSCMQSKQAFVHFKSQIIWKSDPKWSPEGDPKSIKNHEKSILGPSRAPLCASLLDLITINGSQGPPNDRKLSSGESKSGVYPEIVRGSFVRGCICWLQIESLQTLHIFKSFAHLRLQSQGRPAAGATP